MIHPASIALILTYAEPVVCVAALATMYYRRQLSQFSFVAWYLVARFASFWIMLFFVQMGLSHHSPAMYKGYFYAWYGSDAIEAVLGFAVIVSIYKLSMAPLPGLQRLGMLMFRWAGGIAVAIAVSMAVGPNVTSKKFIVAAVTQLQRTQSVLTLCMLLFVCLAIRPMGLSHRSKIFGVSLGLGVISTSGLVSTAWLQHSKNLMNISSLVNSIAFILAVSIWAAYLSIPEPKRRMIVLPTTSPFLRWNQISMALGDEPGFVAIGEVTPDMFAPAEVEVMRRASVKIRTALGA